MNDNKLLIRHYFDAIAGKNTTPVTDYFADDIVWHLPPAHPFGGPFKGIPAVVDMMGRGGKLFDFATVSIRIHALIAEDSDVFAHFQLEATTSEGEPYSNQYIFRFSCSRGRISEVWEFLDTYYQHKMGMYD